MKLNAPKQITWYVAVVLAVLGLIFSFIDAGFLTDISFWLVLASAVLSILAAYLPGL